MIVGKVLLVSMVLASLLYGLGPAGLAQADAVPIPPPEPVQVVPPPVCELVDGAVECTAYREYGIKRIGAYIDTGVGQVEVFDQTYGGCPEVVEFTLDPIVLDYDTNLHVQSCDAPLPEPGVGRPDSGSFRTPSEPARLIGGLVSR
jgi:hypothetical protein